MMMMMMMMSKSSMWRNAMFLVGFLCLLSLSHAELPPNYSFMKPATEAPPVSYYDYIIIGGGTAGCPLAATLSQTSRVLLLERGPAPYGNKNISNLGNFADTLSDTSPTSPSQRFISEDGVISARARVLGGGSCLNAGFYTRASPDYVRQVGWDGRLVNESYQWVEKVVAFEPPMLQWQSAVKDGLLEVGVNPYNGFTFDHMYGTKIGGTIFDKDGFRHTAADLLQYANPPMITVLLHATVSKILFRQKGRPRLMAHGVAFWDGAGVMHRAYLNKGSKNEIIVSAGALGSPQLLMLSGIGPKEHLQSFGINVLLDQPMVGQGMSDNPMNAIYIPSPLPVEISLIQVVGITEFDSYIEAASGSNFAGHSDQPSHFTPNLGMFSPQIGQLSKVPPGKRTPEAIAKAVEQMKSLEVSAFRGGFILEKIMGPVSTGHLELKNLNPYDNPLVTFNYFKEPEDLRRCVQGMEIIEKVIESKAFSKFRYPYISVEALINITVHFPVNLRPRHDNDSKSLEQFCKDTVMTIWHYHGGCHVGRVVDHDYKVLGVDALRIIDGSTLNYSPGTNPQATVMMLGRYMGMKIMSERLGKKE
ncbi:protein HOTHEAD-like [Dioscorea cayenensis subsp. rotundata]|uniref:Protein HOTHEAD-like n=1 Tax=Dioscorea cayennensis subsp. rotundata TaxID=55577 RepID=A0AB40D897_DIOCR|nr:protein HOTHEAD-like [Dioscorea cayenensis subsp. rotundata]